MGAKRREIRGNFVVNQCCRGYSYWYINIMHAPVDSESI